MILDKLSEKDRKTLKVGSLLVAMIIAAGTLNILWDNYSQTNDKLKAARLKLQSVTPGETGKPTHKQAGPYKIVPVFEIPKKEDIPGETFRKEFMSKLGKLRIKYTVLNLMPMSNKKNSCGFRKRNIQCKGKCTFQQAMGLVAALYENPWFVGIEEFKIARAPKTPGQVEFTIMVSTFIK